MFTSRILIDTREYTKWSFQDPESNQPIGAEALSTINPSTHRLFSKDIFSLHTEDGFLDIIHSPIRVAKTLAGVLQLDSNKTYGRTLNKKRLLYKCIPDDKHLPAFLIPYEQKVGFFKTQPNKYVVFRFDQWVDKHPHGILVETLGDVDKLDSFYEYQLYCKSLHVSITEMTNQARTVLNQQSNEDYVSQILENPAFRIQDRRKDYVFTIDPQNSLDFDDGFGIRPHPSDPTKQIISVYIANVYIWLETLGLWDSFSQRVATIYLPDRRRPMLPTVLSDALCSLQEGQTRFAFVMDITIMEDGSVSPEDEIQYCNAAIRVSRNFRYEESRLLKDVSYMNLAQLTKKMDRTATNSHDVVSFWMVQMNTYCARQLAEQKMGIFRSAIFTNPGARSDMDPNLAEDTRRVIRMWNNTSGQYLLFSEDAVLDHQLMGIRSYIHITSPIRRLVDLLNQIMFCRSMMGTISSAATSFLEKWLDQLEYINTSMRSIRKIQTDCELLHNCMTSPDIMLNTHWGVVFDKIIKNDGSVSYMVYLEEWKILSRIVVHQELDNYSRSKFRIFLFEDEDKTKKKIRLQLV